MAASQRIFCRVVRLGFDTCANFGILNVDGKVIKIWLKDQRRSGDRVEEIQRLVNS